jgi:TetR/AcrR family transcriptional repressor of nem operon
MPDVVHFDIEEALDLFLGVFWEKGYKSATTRELAKIAGISEGSLFNSFRSKRDIYIQSLKRYNESGKHLAARMESNESALEGIREYWNTFAKMAMDPSRTNGCMITNATIEASKDPEISELLKSVHLRYDNQFKKMLDRAVAQGEISELADTQALAQFLSNGLQGLRLLGRMNPDEQKVRNILDMTMNAIYHYKI